MPILYLFLLPLLLYTQEIQTRTQVLMGTFVHISLPSQHNAQISEAFHTIKNIENALSSYDKDALVYKLNQNHTVPYNRYLAQALKDSQQYHKDTEGYFDITIGSISKALYHFGEENTTLPSKEALKNAKLNIDAIHINDKTINTVSYITIDLGGMGKGYAVDRVASSLQEQNVTQGIIALSGDIRCLDICHFELQSPYSEQTFAKLTSQTPQLSISTSGTYRRYVKTQEHHHLINPKTASQGRDFVSVSLFAKANNAKIDAYATAVSVMPRKKALAFLKNHKEIGFILVDNRGKILYGNLKGLTTLTWLDHSEKATSPNMKTSTKTKSPIENNLIHPDTNNPKEINK
ncbi:MAG: FAD:protein FMN transferase [Sulfurovum sp.]|uniref:FAD:protein FMN transferase n=1 Tax=Sulfurovum sp. TaxID=1969726 RepID=UPI00286813F8|nr:FAD:protein FMN transferase [Sulfurovum sp.]MCO4846265.1 FAD:protein FMN transferase [Sulfurovum sp.]